MFFQCAAVVTTVYALVMHANRSQYFIMPFPQDVALPAHTCSMDSMARAIHEWRAVLITVLLTSENITFSHPLGSRFCNIQ